MRLTFHVHFKKGLKDQDEECEKEEMTSVRHQDGCIFYIQS